jgi:hypothetical protein
MSKKKAMTSEKASYVKRKGHEDAREFAIALGIGKEFRSDPIAKKDVIDENGFSYSVKSGEKKWQIFLYGKTRFKEDPIFQAMNGIGDLFLECIEAFPENRIDYLRNKTFYKERLKTPMIKLREKLSNKRILRAFIDKAVFNSGEVDFLVIKNEGLFHVFWGKDVVEALTKLLEVENSKARGKGQIDAQKVVFKYNNKTIGEIEMRNDSDIHYREVKFWMSKSLTFDLLKTYINKFNKVSDRIILYGRAINKLKSKTKLKKTW